MKIKQKMKKKTRIILASTLALTLVACATVAYIYKPQQNNTDANNPVVKSLLIKKKALRKLMTTAQSQKNAMDIVLINQLILEISSRQGQKNQ